MYGVLESVWKNHCSGFTVTSRRTHLVNEWKLTCESSAALACNLITDFFVSKSEPKTRGYCAFVSFLQSFEEIAVAARI